MGWASAWRRSSWLLRSFHRLVSHLNEAALRFFIWDISWSPPPPPPPPLPPPISHQQHQCLHSIGGICPASCSWQRPLSYWMSLLSLSAKDFLTRLYYHTSSAAVSQYLHLSLLIAFALISSLVGDVLRCWWHCWWYNHEHVNTVHFQCLFRQRVIWRVQSGAAETEQAAPQKSVRAVTTVMKFEINMWSKHLQQQFSWKSTHSHDANMQISCRYHFYLSHYLRLAS